MRFSKRIFSHTGIFALASTSIWFAVILYGKILNVAPNSACYPYLRCDSGFFGYDAVEHFLFGFAVIWIIVWLCQKFPQYSILNETYWKSALILVALAVSIEVVWEIGECFRDLYLLDIAHETLLNLRLHINYLAQPSNLDTMGDMTFNFLGSLLALPFINLKSVETYAH